jgi:nucleoside-triphosphatase THEP1
MAAHLPLRRVISPIDIAIVDERGAHESLSHKIRPAVTRVDE